MPQVLWPVTTLLLGGALAATWAHAQAPRRPSAAPTVISGSDIGFRVDSFKGTTPVGRLVVRVNGDWVEPEFAMEVTPLHGK